MEYKYKVGDIFYYKKYDSPIIIKELTQWLGYPAYVVSLLKKESLENLLHKEDELKLYYYKKINYSKIWRTINENQKY